MSQIQFFFDEDVSQDVVYLLRQAEPSVSLVCVGDPGALPKRSPDQDVYQAAVAVGRLLVTGDRKTMTGVVVRDLRQGGHNHGVVFLRRDRKPIRVATDLHLMWFCDTAEDWVDRIDYLPF
jgi:hypothetical protein